MNNTVESGGLMPQSVAEMLSKYNYMMVELRDPRWFQGRNRKLSISQVPQPTCYRWGT